MPMLKLLNPNSEIAKASRALAVNISAAKGLLEVMRSNLGPKGTLKLLVSGSGDIKLTKDGNVLLNEMQIKHPTASLIAKAAVAQDDMTGDGTTTIVLLVGEMLKQAEKYIIEGLHPSIITDGFEMSKEECLKILETMKIKGTLTKTDIYNVAKTSLRSKISQELADILTNIVVEAVNFIKEDQNIDLHRVEIMEMKHKTEIDTMLIKGLVLDHGARHPNMAKKVTNAYILTCNISLEYEKTEVNSGLFYNTAADRDNLVKSERKFIDDRVEKIVQLKKKVCDDSKASGDKKFGFVVINQKGIDPYALDLLAKAGIVALRRAKKRNMERLVLACGGKAVNSLEGLTPECLGFAGTVYEHVLGEDKFTFIEECKNPKSVTILIKGPAKYILTRTKDAIKDGLRSVKNAIEEGIVPGAGSFYLTCYKHLRDMIDDKIPNERCKGKVKLGVEAFAQALLIIPNTLATNSGFDTQDTIISCLEALATASKTSQYVGIDLDTGNPMIPKDLGIFDNYNVVKHSLYSSSEISSNILLVDEMLAAGISTLKK